MTRTSHLFYLFLIVTLLTCAGMVYANDADAPSPSASPSPAASPPQVAPQGEQMQLFQWRADVQILQVHPVVVETLRGLMGLSELEARQRTMGTNAGMTQAYVNKLIEKINALEKDIEELKHPKPAPKAGSSSSKEAK